MSSIKINDIYELGDKEMVITHLFERVRSKKSKVTLIAVKEVDLEDVPPPRRDLHQNRYGQCELDGKKMFMKFLSSGFYRRSKQYHNALLPYAKKLFIKSHFDDEKRIIVQPKMKGTMSEIKLLDEHVEKNIKRIKAFVDKIKKCEDKSIRKCFNLLDVNRENFMIDDDMKNLYLIDFDPWTRLNDISVWGEIMKEIRI